jgi:hypothetical protein
MYEKWSFCVGRSGEYNAMQVIFVIQNDGKNPGEPKGRGAR